MLGLLRFLFFSLLAIAAGVAAVSVPVAGKTVAAHVQSLSADLLAEEAPARPAAAKKPSPTAAPAPKRKNRPPESDPTPAERAALDDLIDARTARKPAPDR